MIRTLAVGAILICGCEKHADEAAPPPPAPAPALAPVAADAAVVTADAGPPRGELVVTASAPRPGTSSIITFDAKVDFDLNFGGLAIVTASKQSKKKTVEIVAVDPDGTVHKRITYTKRDTNIVVDGQRKPDPSPVRGKTFRLTVKDGNIVDVKRGDGKPATEDEVSAVGKEEGQLQAPERLGSALAGLRLVEGEPFEVPLAAIEKMINGDYKPKRVVLTYRGKTAQGARIDAEAALANEEAGLKMYLDLTAELLVDPTGWCLSANVTGQVRAELNGTVVGSGAGTGAIAATPLR